VAGGFAAEEAEQGEAGYADARPLAMESVRGIIDSKFLWQ
jgi:hypothetical protein